MKRSIVQISNGILSQILQGMKNGFNGRFKVIKNGLPADAKIIRSYNKDGIIEMIIESESFKDVKDAPIPVLEPPIMSSIQEKDPVMWLCGENRKETAFGDIWDFHGLFNLRDDAIGACKTDNHFVVPVQVDEEMPNPGNWSVIEYPLRGQE